VLLENYYLPGDLKAWIGMLVDYYYSERYHESMNNLTPEQVSGGEELLNFVPAATT
jgi:putative transposase